MVVNSSEPVAEPNVNRASSANAATWRRLTVLAVRAVSVPPSPMAPPPLKASVRPAPVKVMSLLIVKVPRAVRVRLADPVAAPVRVMSPPVSVNAPPRETLLPLNDSALVPVAMMLLLSVKVPLAVMVRSRLLTAAPVSMMAAPLNVFAPLLLKLIPIVPPLRVISPPVEMSAKILTTVALIKVRLLVPVKVMLLLILKMPLVASRVRARLLSALPLSVIAAPVNVTAVPVGGSVSFRLIPLVPPLRVIAPPVGDIRHDSNQRTAAQSEVARADIAGTATASDNLS